MKWPNQWISDTEEEKEIQVKGTENIFWKILGEKFSQPKERDAYQEHTKHTRTYRIYKYRIIKTYP